MLTDYLFCHLQEMQRWLLKFFFKLLCTKHSNIRFQFPNWWRKFLRITSKNEEEAYEKTIDMSNNDGYTTGNLLDFAYFKENYRLITMDLRKQTKLNDPQKNNFIGKFEGQNNGVTIYFIIEKSEESTFNFFKNSVTVI